MLHTIKFHIFTEQSKQNYSNVIKVMESLLCPSFATVSKACWEIIKQCTHVSRPIRERKFQNLSGMVLTKYSATVIQPESQFKVSFQKVLLNELTAIILSFKSNQERIFWLYDCDCGSTVYETVVTQILPNTAAAGKYLRNFLIKKLWFLDKHIYSVISVKDSKCTIYMWGH